MSSYLTMAMRNLYDMGILDIILPFILVFTIIFAVLQRTKVLGKDDDGHPVKNFNVVIALVMGLATVMPHVLWGSGSPKNPYLSNGMLDIVQVINNALPSVSLIVVAVLMLLIIIGIWGKNIDIGGTSLGGLVTIVSIAAIAIIFIVAAGGLRRWGWLNWLRLNQELQMLIVIILVFGLIIRFITGPSEKKKGKDDDGALVKLSKALKDSDK